MTTEMTIGQMSKEIGVNPKTVRYYEEIGLLPRAQRNRSGYRVYSGADRERLILIRRARLLGLSLAETKELVGNAIDGNCAVLESRLARLLGERLADIDRRMEDLIRIRASIRRYRRNLPPRSSPRISQVVAAEATVCRCMDNKEEKGGKPWQTKGRRNRSRTLPNTDVDVDALQ